MTSLITPSQEKIIQEIKDLSSRGKMDMTSVLLIDTIRNVGNGITTALNVIAAELHNNDNDQAAVVLLKKERLNAYFLNVFGITPESVALINKSISEKIEQFKEKKLDETKESPKESDGVEPTQNQENTVLLTPDDPLSKE